MLTKIKIRNFQAHAKLDLELDPHVTTIVGPSDVGKSSIIRALKWVATNQPSGESFIRSGAKFCEVKLSVDGHEITRKRSNSENSYLLDVQRFNSFGQNVPDPIAKLLNVSPVNFQGQHDSPFWLADTAGQVSRSLNAIVDLDVIDESLSEAARQASKARLILETATDRNRKAREAKKAVQWVPEAGRDLKEVERAEANHARLATRTADLGRVIDQVVEHEDRYYCLAEAGRGARKVVSVARALKLVAQKRHRLLKIVEQITELGGIEAPDMAQLDAAAESYREVLEERQKLEGLVEECLDKTTKSCNRYAEFREAEDILKERMDGRCPLCGSEIS